VTSRGQPWFRNVRPLLWLPLTVAAFGLFDRALDAIYGQHVTSQTVLYARVKSKLARSAEVVVIGDSCGRYSVDAGALGAQLGTTVMNLATFGAGLPGQIASVTQAMDDGHEYRAIVVLALDDAFARAGDNEKDVTRQYYVSPAAFRMWLDNGSLTLGEGMRWVWSWLSPTFAAGGELQKWVDELWSDAYKSGSIADPLKKLKKLRRKHNATVQALLETRGQSRGEDHDEAPSKLVRRVQRELRVSLSPHRKWNAAQIGPMYSGFVARAERAGTPVFHAFCPRPNEFTKHRNWANHFEEPERRWADTFSAKHQNFFYWMRKRMSFPLEQFANTPNHPAQRAARQVTTELGNAMLATPAFKTENR
jgi:hypothetical protein